MHPKAKIGLGLKLAIEDYVFRGLEIQRGFGIEWMDKGGRSGWKEITLSTM